MTPSRGQTHCIFCSDAELENQLGQWGGQQVTKTLKALKEFSRLRFADAISNIRGRKGDVVAEDFEWRVGRAERVRQPPRSARDKWEAELANRRRALGGLEKQEQKAFEDLVRRDRATARRKILLPEARGQRITAETEEKELEQLPLPPADLAINDAGLPQASRSERAKFAELWCKQGSWVICEKCHSLRPRPLQPMDLKRVAQPTIKKCLLCKKKEYVPQPNDVPEQLRDLGSNVLKALRPLDIDVGVYERAQQGYRVHSSMVRFAWPDKDVQEKIRLLPRGRDRTKARRAFRFLMTCEESAYSDFVERHRKFLRRHPAADEKKRKLPLRFLEEQGLECAAWPHLYWHRNLCETTVRATDERRLAARRTGLSSSSSHASEQEGESGSDDAGADVRLSKGRHSIRHNFLKKVLSPVIGYGEEYELLHFVYDLAMWSSLGGCKNSAKNIPLRLAVKGASWSPAYWRVRHLGLIDMQRQCGLPQLFRTRAPFEQTFPYHQWVMDEMLKTGRPRRFLAGAETLHMTHVLKEFDRGLFSGSSQNSTSRVSRRWQHDHLLGSQEGADAARSTTMNFFSRIEFQDGKRKRGTQRYHGSGRPHSHSLDFLENVEDIMLEEKMAATVPPETEPLLRGVVLDSQLDYRESGWPVREEPSAWDAEGGCVLLHHTEEDKDLHVRAYFKDTMEVTKCHEDILQGDGFRESQSKLARKS